MIGAPLALGAPWGGLAHLVGRPEMRWALVAGTAAALAAGMVGFFMVLRAEVFAGDALSHVAVTGALGALAAGIELRLGLYGACVATALLLGLLARAGRAQDAVTGIVFAWILGLGALFLSLYTGRTADPRTGINVLFGSILGLSPGTALGTAGLSLGVVLATVAIGRPLLFASIDPEVARARGVPVGLLGVAFLVLAGVTAAAATQAVGGLLLLGLLSAPAGAAQRLTASPARAMWLSSAIAVGSVWAGIVLSYNAPRVPPSFGIVSAASAAYLLAFVGTHRHRARRGERPGRA